MQGQLLDQHGQPLTSPKEDGVRAELSQLRAQVAEQAIRAFHERRMMRAKYDAAQTFGANENHWSNADNYDPHTVASLHVRQKLRSRSRYEVIENNPYLKGTILTICNDFVGTGPTLQITDQRLTKNRRKIIEDKFQEWAKITNLSEKLWRMRMAKIVDGEAFAMFYNNKNRRYNYPIQLDLYVIETDRISGQNTAQPTTSSGIAEIDGVRFDQYENPLAYFLLHQHPGGSALANFALRMDDNGEWINAKQMLHWFRRDRGWLRGIPETAPSLPLCALLRRYTLATVRQREAISDFTVLLETQNPASPQGWTANGQLTQDDPFDLFPLEMGMIMNLPMGYTAKQMEGVPAGDAFDAFVGCLLREITRPLMATYNLASGSSKDSNMASAVVDTAIYKGSQEAERHFCEDPVLCPIFTQWWYEAKSQYGYLGDNFLAYDPQYRDQPPKHRWRWDQVGIEHTDPQKVAEALKIMHDKRFLTDADIQEGRFNRSVETWRMEIEQDEEFRGKLEPVNPEERQPPPAPGEGSGASPKGKSAAKPKPKSKKPARK